MLGICARAPDLSALPALELDFLFRTKGMEESGKTERCHFLGSGGLFCSVPNLA